MKSATSTTNESRVQDLHRYLRAISASEHIDVDSAFVPAALRDVQQRHPGLDGGQALRLLFDEGLMSLRQSDPHDADLLEGRFWQGLTVAQMVMAQRPEPQSERRFYQQQARAIARLAETLTAFNHACESTQRIQNHLHVLPLPTYDRLFGTEEKAQQVFDLLATPDQHFIVSLKGMGGIGKTALADAVARRLVRGGGHFSGLVWISAKQQFMTTSGVVGDPTPMRVDEIINDLGAKLGLEHFAQLPRVQKSEQLAQILRSTPYLIVIDNLESVADFYLLQGWLNALAGPTKFLLTNREAVPSIENISTVEVNELDEAAAIALIAHVAAQRHIDGIESRHVYAHTGGNPLAIILVVSLMTILPPAEVLGGMRHPSFADLYTYIYAKAWSVLTDAARALLFTIQRAGDSAGDVWLSLLHPETKEVLFGAIQMLQSLSLIQVQQHTQGRRIYSIHRLTSTFLQTQVMGADAAWTERYYTGYLREGRLALQHIAEHDLDEVVFEHALNLVQTYAHTTRPRQDMGEADRVMLTLAYRITFHSSSIGAWNAILMAWPKLCTIALHTEFDFAYVYLTCFVALTEEKMGRIETARRLHTEIMDSPVFARLSAEIRSVFVFQVGTFHLWQGNLSLAQSTLEVARALVRENEFANRELSLLNHGGESLLQIHWPVWQIKANILNQLGNVAMFSHRFAEAESLFNECLALIRAHESVENIACIAYQSLGRLFLFQERYEEAQAILQQGLRIRQSQSDVAGMLSTSVYLGASLLGAGKVEEAEEILQETLTRCGQVNLQREEALSHLYLGQAKWLRKDNQIATYHWHQMLDAAQQIPFYRMELHVVDYVLSSNPAEIPNNFYTRAQAQMKSCF